MNGARVALCHEWVTTYGGSEQVAQRLAQVLDAEGVFTFAARSALASELFPGRNVHVHRWGSTRRAGEHWQWFLPLMPAAWSQLDLRGFDVVVTSAHSCVNAIRVPRGALHVSYCHTPMRYAWAWREEIGRVPTVIRPVWPLAAAGLRRADGRWARRVDVWVANSHHVATRIREAYGREAAVVYPPIDTAYWTPGGSARRGAYFLVAGRLVAYKKVLTAVQAATIAHLPLVVAGDGPELESLRGAAGSTTRFVVRPTREELRDLYREATALVMPGVEDFGMTMIEAQACGTPVIAYGVGGALEAVLPGRTGILYRDPSPEALAAEMLRFDASDLDVASIRANAERFDSSVFDAAMVELVTRHLEQRSGRSSTPRELVRSSSPTDGGEPSAGLLDDRGSKVRDPGAKGMVVT